MNLKERFASIETQPSKCIVLHNTSTTHLDLKPAILQLFSNFYGKKNENLYTHVNEFLDICSTFKF